MTLLYQLLGLAGLIALNAFFVAGEYGLVTSRRTRITELEREGDRRARAVLRITADPPHFIAAMQLGVTFTSLAIGALGETIFAELFGSVMATALAVVLALLVVSFLHVVLGELVPKGVALSHPERIALAVSTPIRGFFFVFAPFVWLLQRSTEVVLRAGGLTPPGAEREAHSEAELRMLLLSSAQQGEIEPVEQEMVYKVFDFADKEAHEVMVPRPQVVALSADLPTQEALGALVGSPYTRYPVYRDSLDDVLGILHVRDLFRALYDRGIENVEVEELIRPAYVVPETKDLAALLAEFRDQNQHMAIVVDEYGGVAGIVTLEDLLEEIVGEIEDEYDLPDESVERLDERRIRIAGTFPIDDFNEQFGQEIPQEDFHTVAGFVFGELGRAPDEGDELTWDGLRFGVVETDGTRIGKLEVEFLSPEEQPEPQAEPGPSPSPPRV